jgi:hypothetical protein
MCTAPTGRTQDCTRPQRQTIKLILAMREPSTQVTVALANKAARVVWAIMVRGGFYHMPAEVRVTTSV